MNIGIETILIGASAVCFLSLTAVAAIIIYTRRTVVRFTDEITAAIDCCMRGEMPERAFTEDTLADKVRSRLALLYEAMRLREEAVNREREELQSLISDVTHQVRTPMTNLRMLNETLLETALEQQAAAAKELMELQSEAAEAASERQTKILPEAETIMKEKAVTEQQVQFLQSAQKQIQRLDFLMEALIKTSRLETGLITLSKKETSVCDTLADALGGVLLAAEKKNLNITVDCNEALTAFYDRKWTTEAVFNLLDNAVKYTQADGHIRISAQQQEMYLQIRVSDDGPGIEEKHHNLIWKRFFREDSVHEEEGAGVGLYLVRQIAALQGGYVKVRSEKGRGADFYIYLPLILSP